MALLEILPLMLVLLLSAIPVALPVMYTVSMAVGARELAKRSVLVTRLSATEDAATMDVLCVDKTGTLTLNELSISQVFPMGSFTEREAVLFGALASQEANRDPLDLAFIRRAREMGWPGPGRRPGELHALRRGHAENGGRRPARRPQAPRHEGGVLRHRPGLRPGP